MASRFLKNLHRLDDKVFRSAQPSRQGFLEAEDLGMTDVLNLREYHVDRPPRTDSPLTFHEVKIDTDEITVTEIVAALRIVRNAPGPLLIHCWHGSDRTGAVCAMYRVVFQKWSKEEAVDEMLHGGFGYHGGFKNIIQLIKTADIADIAGRVFGKQREDF